MSRSEREREQTAAPPPPARKAWRRTALGARDTSGADAGTGMPSASATRGAADVADPSSRASGATDAIHELAADESFAARLRYLFAATRQPDGRPWSANAVARASGGRLTAQAVYSLYRGATPNPKLETILALADVLSVDPEYFVNPGALGRLKATHAGQYAALEADPHIAFVSRRMGQMTPQDKAIIVAMVQRLTETSAAKNAAPDSLDAAVVAQMRQDLR